MQHDLFRNAIVAHANFAQFDRGQTITLDGVKSRMLLWCKVGSGIVTANGTRHAFTPGQYLVLPWSHTLRYAAAKRDPFLLAGVHVIPWHSRGQRVVLQVSHDRRHPLDRAKYRRDVEIPELREVRSGQWAEDCATQHLAEYIVRLFLRGLPDEQTARRLGEQMLGELKMLATGTAPGNHVPPELERMKQYVEFHIHNPLSLRDLVEFSGLSASSVGRLFHTHLGVTPVEWVLRRKICEAQTLLRTTQLTLMEVAARVGIADVSYFSKRFQRETGTSPLRYRRETPWI